MSASILPRLVRLRDAPFYLGMDPNRFNEEVRPYLTEMPIGKQGVALTVLTWTRGSINIGVAMGVPANGKASGTSTRLSEEQEFAKALERATSKKRKDT